MDRPVHREDARTCLTGRVTSDGDSVHTSYPQITPDLLSEAMPSRVPPHQTGHRSRGMEDTVDGGMLSGVNSEMLMSEQEQIDSGMGVSLTSSQLNSGSIRPYSHTSASHREPDISEGLEGLDISEHGDEVPRTSLESPHAQDYTSLDDGFYSESVHSHSPRPKTTVAECSEHTTTSINAPIRDEKLQIIERIYTPDDEGDTQVHLAIIHGEDALCFKMISLAPFPQVLDTTNELGQTPLHLAALMDQYTVVQNLLQKGARVDIRDRNGNTPLHLSCKEGHLMCVRALTQKIPTDPRYPIPSQPIPQDMTLKNYDGETCLHLATLHNHPKVIEYLTGEYVHCNINIRDGRSGRTALHYAAELNAYSMVEFLLRSGANPNARAYDGTTPLQVSAGRQFDDILALLLSSGADDTQLQQYYSDSEDSTDEEDMITDDFTTGPTLICT